MGKGWIISIKQNQHGRSFVVNSSIQGWKIQAKWSLSQDSHPSEMLSSQSFWIWFFRNAFLNIGTCVIIMWMGFSPARKKKKHWKIKISAVMLKKCSKTSKSLRICIQWRLWHHPMKAMLLNAHHLLSSGTIPHQLHLVNKGKRCCCYQKINYYRGISKINYYSGVSSLQQSSSIEFNKGQLNILSCIS